MKRNLQQRKRNQAHVESAFLAILFGIYPNNALECLANAETQWKFYCDDFRTFN